MAEREVDRSVSQTVKAQLALRDQILSGTLRPGERISELQAVETTGASRTPVRMALVRLGAVGGRYTSVWFGLRGWWEGPAARFAAERGVSAGEPEPLKECLSAIDE